MKDRIWELDAIRGLCILAMVAVHLVYDLQIPTGPAFAFVQSWGGVLFFLLSGLCATLGSHPVKRGLLVFGAGVLCTAVTWGLSALSFLPRDMVIRFGVLHCLGLCMLLWPVFQKLPDWLLAALGAALAALGIYLTQAVYVSFSGFAWLGLLYPAYFSADYFPLLPYLGFFLLGAVLGRVLYGKKRSLLPGIGNFRFFRALQWCGRHSLILYLLHQPVLMLLFL